MNPAWEQARRAIRPVSKLGPFTTEPVELEELAAEAPCVACGELAWTAYRGWPFHVLCTLELAIYLVAVRRGLAPALPPFDRPALPHSTRTGAGGV
jgi:hypothetical protein